MGLIQPFEPMPDFEPTLSESVRKHCKDPHDLWMAEQSDIRRKQIVWLGHKMLELSSAMKTEWELGTSLRNKVQLVSEDLVKLRGEIVTKEIIMLKKETMGEKMKTYALIIGLIAGMIGVYDAFKRSIDKPTTTQKP
jgi:hypothetical protein